jgi:hypothetical protein
VKEELVVDFLAAQVSVSRYRDPANINQLHGAWKATTG